MTATPRAKPGRKRRAGDQPIERFEMKLGESELAEIDAARGATDRATFVRDAALSAARGEPTRYGAPAAAMLDRAAERLVFALHIYRGYKVDSRGPAGCIMEALDRIAPGISASIRKIGEDATYEVRWDANGAPR